MFLKCPGRSDICGLTGSLTDVHDCKQFVVHAFEIKLFLEQTCGGAVYTVGIFRSLAADSEHHKQPKMSQQDWHAEG